MYFQFTVPFGDGEYDCLDYGFSLCVSFLCLGLWFDSVYQFNHALGVGGNDVF